MSDEFLILFSLIFPIIVMVVFFQLFISFGQNRTSDKVYVDHLQQNRAILFLTWKFSLLILLIICSFIICLFSVFSFINIDSFIFQFTIIILLIIMVLILYLWLFSRLFPSKFVEFNNCLILSLYDSFMAIPFSAFSKVIIDQPHKRIQLTFHYSIAKNFKNSFQSVLHCQNSEIFDVFNQILKSHNVPIQFKNLNFISSFLTTPFRLVSTSVPVALSTVPVKLSAILSELQKFKQENNLLNENKTL